jgi:hypothetical protein
MACNLAPGISGELCVKVVCAYAMLYITPMRHLGAELNIGSHTT